MWLRIYGSAARRISTYHAAATTTAPPRRHPLLVGRCPASCGDPSRRARRRYWSKSRLSQIHARAVLRSGAMERLPRRNQRPLRFSPKMLLVQSQDYRQQYGFNSIFLLPLNLYGPGDNFDPESSHVIPALLRKCIEAQEPGADHIVAWGDGSPTRECLYVADRRDRAGSRALQRERPGESRQRVRNQHQRPFGDHRPVDGLRGPDCVGHDQTERAATPEAGYHPRGKGVWVSRDNSV